MAIVKTKVPNFTGVRCSVMFVNGVGETSDPWLMEWFAQHGYEVCEDTLEMKERAKTKPIDEMTLEEMKSYLRSIGQAGRVGNYKDRDKMAAHVKAVLAELAEKQTAQEE